MDKKRVQNGTKQTLCPSRKYERVSAGTISNFTNPESLLKSVVFKWVSPFLKKWDKNQKRLVKTLDKSRKKEYNTDKNKNKHRKRGFDYGYDE